MRIQDLKPFDYLTIDELRVVRDALFALRRDRPLADDEKHVLENINDAIVRYHTN